MSSRQRWCCYWWRRPPSSAVPGALRSSAKPRPNLSRSFLQQDPPTIPQEAFFSNCVAKTDMYLSVVVFPGCTVRGMTGLLQGQVRYVSDLRVFLVPSDLLRSLSG